MSFHTTTALAECTAGDGAVLSFGFLPITNTKQLAKLFVPLTQYLSEKTGCDIRFETAPDFSQFVTRTHADAYDFLFTAPHLYYLAHTQANYRALASVKSDGMAAIIVARKDRGYKSLQDLKGKRIATLPELALGTVLGRHYLQEQGFDLARDISLVETPTHKASLLSTYKGVTDAAILMEPPYQRAEAHIRSELVVLGRTRATPHVNISASQRMPAEVVTQVKNALFAMHENETGKQVLSRLTWPQLVEANTEAYLALEWVFEH